MTKDKRDGIDRAFDFLDKVVGGAEQALSGVPEPDSDDDEEEMPKYVGQTPRVIDVPAEEKKEPLLKSGTRTICTMHGIACPPGCTAQRLEAKPEQKKPREVTLHVRMVNSRPRGEVNIIAETPTHDVVCIRLSAEDWKKVVDAADWMRMVPE